MIRCAKLSEVETEQQSSPHYRAAEPHILHYIILYYRYYGTLHHV